MHTHIRAYKTIDGNGYEDFEVTVSGGRATRTYVCVDMNQLARNVASEVMAKDNTGNTAIDLKPEHDILCSPKGTPRRCFPVNERDISFFWYRFKQCLKQNEASTLSPREGDVWGMHL